MKETRTLCDICRKNITDKPFEATVSYNCEVRVRYDLCRRHKIDFEMQLKMHIINFLNNQRHIATGEKLVKK